MLFTFKYFNFFSASLADLLSSLGIQTDIRTLDVLLPVGISFYTFQSMAYTIDVFRQKTPVERHLGYFALYVSFFPQLVGGPIERAQNILPQLRVVAHFDADRVNSGLRLVLWGFFQKVVVADRLAVYTNAVYNDVEQFTGVPLILATVFFTIQIYCDFAGYSNIAIGVARIMGIQLMQNFRQPYFATSVREYWARWHISLSTWFRDHMYIPFRMVVIGILFLGDWIEARIGFDKFMEHRRLSLRWGLYYTLLVSLGFTLIFQSASEAFIYFQF